MLFATLHRKSWLWLAGFAILKIIFDGKVPILMKMKHFILKDRAKTENIKYLLIPPQLSEVLTAQLPSNQ